MSSDNPCVHVHDRPLRCTRAKECDRRSEISCRECRVDDSEEIKVWERDHVREIRSGNDRDPCADAC